MIWFAPWWSISEINNQKISMLGRDTHIISNLSSNFVLQSHMSTMCSIVYHFIKERVHLWNHEPRSIFNHKKHLSNHFYHFSIFYHLKIRKYKITFTSCIHHIKPKNIIYHCYHHPCIFIYHHCIFISCLHCILSWYHSYTLCLTTTGEVEDQNIYLVLQVTKRRTGR